MLLFLRWLLWWLLRWCGDSWRRCGLFSLSDVIVAHVKILKLVVEVAMKFLVVQYFS